MYSACRITSATMVSVGFAAPAVVITEPSQTNRIRRSALRGCGRVERVYGIVALLS
jgi:hypothetical protein